MRFHNKTVVVTGAASGIGRATALLFAAEGAKVYAADIDEAGLAQTAAESNGEVHTVRCDVCNTEDIKALMDRAAAETGGIDALFNNAGAGGDPAIRLACQLRPHTDVSFFQIFPAHTTASSAATFRACTPTRCSRATDW